MAVYEITWRTDNLPVESGPIRETVDADSYTINTDKNGCLESITFFNSPNQAIRQIFTRPASISRLPDVS